jgi:uncharacterized membrane-anchored protein
VVELLLEQVAPAAVDRQMERPLARAQELQAKDTQVGKAQTGQALAAVVAQVLLAVLIRWTARQETAVMENRQA